ncbi:hypothetical protein OF830_22160 [Bacillus paramycoides]|uniref:hypothetical protein n=1 Tax=Bacillus paramycoides TaxID=2026194 RepID=UPI0022443C6E|nr:hypothetical protein [Bacillus paramycoides]MCW9133589.1 hypothetical protein [Bacillus paramycoides]
MSGEGKTYSEIIKINPFNCSDKSIFCDEDPKNTINKTKAVELVEQELNKKLNDEKKEVLKLVKYTSTNDPFDFRVPSAKLFEALENMFKELELHGKSNKEYEDLLSQAKAYGLIEV